MNWDMSIGQCKQWYGRLLQSVGERLERRQLVLDGERIEYSGRLQSRYGTLKHHVQWGASLARAPRDIVHHVNVDSLQAVKRVAP